MAFCYCSGGFVCRNASHAVVRNKMVSKQFTTLSMLMPVAMSVGTLISVYAYKNSYQSLAMVAIAGSALLIILLFYTYGKSKSKRKIM